MPIWLWPVLAAIGVGGAIGLWKLSREYGRRLARRAGFVKSPYLGPARRSAGNNPGEDHILLHVPIQYRRWGSKEYRDDFRAILRWYTGPPGRPYSLAFAGGPRLEDLCALRRARPRTVLIAVRSVIGEVGKDGVRLASEPSELRVDAPKDAARLLNMDAIWNMAGPRIDFPPGTHHVAVEIHHGEFEQGDDEGVKTVVHRAGYCLEVPHPGESNDSFSLTLEWAT